MSADIRADIAAKLKEINPTVAEKAIAAIVDREVEKRANTIVQGLDKLRDLERDLKKIKPDSEQYDTDGKLVSSGYTQAKLKELVDHRQKIDKLSKAIDKALNGDLGDLNNICGKG